MSDTNVRFLHDSRLGITIGYILNKHPNDKVSVLGSISFAHKSSPSGKIKAEMFSRKVGRKITTERIDSFIKLRGTPPNIFTFNGESKAKDIELRQKIEEQICMNLRAIKGSLSSDYRYNTARSEEQITNSYILNLISEIVGNVIRTSNTNSGRHEVSN